MEEKVAANEHRMISESMTLKTESLKSDNAVNSACIKLINYISKYIQIENTYLKL